MPKIQKNKKQSKKYKSKQERLKQMKMDQAQKKKVMFKSTALTYLLSVIMFVLSLLFNAGFIPIEFGESTAADFGEIFLKAIVVILFFFFMLVSVGNYKEMTGYIATWKELTVVLVISLLMGSSQGMVFFVTFLGIVLVLTYVYFLQNKAE